MRAIWALLMVVGTCLCDAAEATPAPPEVSAQIAAIRVGALCQPLAKRTEPAPDTALGYISIAKGAPQISVETQAVPDAIGLAFGVMVVPARSIAQVRLKTFRPGQAAPDVFYSTFTQGKERVHYFSFEFPQEQLPGPWRMEAWDGDALLYRVEFDVLPEEALPDMVARCRAMS